MSSDKTLTILGCGTLSRAILGGVISALDSTKSDSATNSTPVPSKFVCCVKRDASAETLKKDLNSSRITALANSNVEGAKQGDIILLGCKPWMAKEILSEPGMSEAIEGKLLISILAGTNLQQLKDLCPASTRIVRVMPNTPSKIREGMAVICGSESISTEEKDLVAWIFNQVGKTLFLPEKNIDAVTALSGSGPAFAALFLEAMADGGVMMGLTRADAQLLAAQTMQGTARMVLDGLHPTVLREQVSTPGGCTIGGLLTLEDGGVRGKIARCVQDATNIAAGLGKK